MSLEDTLKKYGAYKGESPKVVETSAPKIPSYSIDDSGNRVRKQRERPVRIPRDVDREQLIWNYYVPDKIEQKSLKARAVDKVKDLLGVLEDMSRPYFFVAGGLNEIVDEVKKNPLNALKYSSPLVSAAFAAAGDEGVKNTYKEAWKGLTLEEKDEVRDIAKKISPDTMKWIEDNTTFKVWGIEMDAASVPLFLASIPVDPLTWVPIGASLKLLKSGGGIGVKAVRAVGETVSPELTSKIIENGTKAIDRLAPYFNVKYIMNRKYKSVDGGTTTLGDLYGTFLSSFEAAGLKSELAVKEAATIAEKSGLLGKTVKLASEDQSGVLYQAFQNAADESFDVAQDLFAKQLGMDVQEFAKLHKADKILSEISMMDQATLPKDMLKQVDNIVSDMKTVTAKKLTARLIEHRGIKGMSKSLSKIEKEGALILAKTRRDTSQKIYALSIASRQKELDAMKKVLQSDTGAVFNMLKEDVLSTVGSVSNIQKDLMTFVKMETPEVAEALKSRLSILQTRVAYLSERGEDVLKTTQGLQKGKTGLRQGTVDSLVRQVNSDMNRLLAGAVRGSKKELVADINKGLSNLKKAVGLYGKDSLKAVKSLKGSVNASARLQKDAVRQFQERVVQIGGELKELSKLSSQENLMYQIAVRKADKFAKKQARRYEKAFTALTKGSSYQKVLVQLKKKNDEIFAKHVATLPEELKPAAYKTRELFETMKKDLSEAGLTKGIDTIYAPRAISNKYLEMFEKGLPESRTSTGFLKHRKFDTFKEFKNYIESNGGKINNDLYFLTLENAISGEMAIARKNLKDGILARIGVETFQKDKNLQRSLDYLFKQGRTKINNPASSWAVSLYGRTLNTIKFMLTAPNIAFQTRNALGFPFLSMTTSGMKHGLNPTNYVDAFLIKTGRSGKIGKYSFDEIRKAATESGYFGGSLTRGNIERSGKMVLDRHSWASPKRWMGEIYKLSIHSEDLGRTGALVANLKSGKSMSEAIDAAKKAMFDYNLINSPVDKAMDGALGFYTFTRRNISRQIMTALEDPKQYSILGRALNKMSNREQLSQEELEHLARYDKEAVTMFGDVVDGVREFSALGFLPAEEAYKTLNSLASFKNGDWKEWASGLITSRISPLIGTFLDWVYNKDSFRGTELGTSLPSRYTSIIPKKIQKAWGLTEKTVNKYRAGEVVGTEKKLYGDPDVIFALRRIPVYSRQLNDIAYMVDAIKGNGSLPKAITRTLTGVRAGELDLESAKRFREMRERKELVKAVKKGGGKVVPEIPYIPKDEKRTDQFKDAVKKTRRTKKRN